MRSLYLKVIVSTSIILFLMTGISRSETLTGTKLFLNESITDDTNEKQIYSILYPTTTSSSYSKHIGAVHHIRPLINTGITQSGYEMGILNQVLRNNYTSSADENGTLNNLIGCEIVYGHYSTNTEATPATTNVYGLYLYPYYQTGTITNLYDLFINSGLSGGAITNRYAIYQKSSAAKNYFAGNVGIGTSSPQSLLAVNGTITTKEVKVTSTGWSDFVFEDDYNLPSLDQVESYIEENKHLPDVPSAEEVQENGLSLAEIVTKQMQKIEELTLYVIEQNKKIETLENKLATLEKNN